MRRSLRRPWRWAVTWGASGVLLALLTGCEPGDYTIIIEERPAAFLKGCTHRQGQVGDFVLRCQSLTVLSEQK